MELCLSKPVIPPFELIETREFIGKMYFFNKK